MAENRQALTTRRPALARPRYNLAVFLKPDNPIEARQEFRAVVKQRPEDAAAHYDVACSWTNSSIGLMPRCASIERPSA